MLKAQHSAGGAALAVTMLIAFSHVAVRTGRAAAVPPERPDVPAGTAPNSVATFHTFDIEEVFSNFDGSVQFIELHETAGVNGNHHFAGNQLTSNTNLFTFPTDLPDSATANRFVLIATASFAALPGAATPDYIIPERFFEVTGDTISIFESQGSVLVDTFIFGAPPQDPCTCDGDVDNNGSVDFVDGGCIMECRGGDCSCCLSSCDVNCDGVVDTGDIGDDVLNDDSAWLCLFLGGSPEACCPGPFGACCDTTTGGCTDDVLESDCTAPELTWSEGMSCADVTCTGPPTGACCDLGTGSCREDLTAAGCTGANEAWSEGMSCAEVTCTGPPTGACCDLGTGSCREDVTAAGCAGVNEVWSEGMSCAAVSCPTPPDGACCNLGNGHCQDGVLAVACDGPGLVWTEATLCSAVECAVPPQDPCTCDGDVDNNGSVNFVDGGCIMECRGGDCSCCLSSCDVNCDGVVDTGDIGDDVQNDDSAWLCLFEGGSPEACCPGPSGACCDTTTSGCTDDVLESDCTAPELTWSEGMSCVEVTCTGPAAVSSPIPADGACCNVKNGQCQDGVPEVDCTGIGLVWTASTTCSALSCVATFLPTDGALSLNSDGTTSVNSPTNFAGEMGSVNAAPSIPTMSRTSLVVMMLLVVTAAVAIMRTRRRGISPSS